MAWMRTFTFNGVRSDTYFLTQSIRRDLLPPVAVQTLEVPKRPGAYVVGSTLGVRTIEVQVSLLRTTPETLRADVRRIAAWLFQNEDKMLTFSDEPDKYYLARLQGGTDLADNLAMGETTLTFLCADPFAYAVNETLQTGNMMQRGYDTFDTIAAGTILPAAAAYNTQGSIVNTVSLSGSNSFRLAPHATSTNNFVYLGNSTTDYHIPVVVGKKYIFSVYAYATVPALVQLSTRFNNESNQFIQSSQLSIPANAWTRLSFTITVPAGATLMTTRLDCEQANTELFFDNIMLEAALEGQTQPSAFTPAAQKVLQVGGTYQTFPRLRVIPVRSGLTYFRATYGSQVLLLQHTFTARNAVIIDCYNNVVYEEATGARLMNKLDIASDFFALTPGTNTITIDPPEGFGVEVYWRNRWL